MDRVHESMDHPWLGPPWTGGPSSSELGLPPLRCARAPTKGRRMGDEVGEPVKGLIRGRAVVKWPGDGGEQAAAVGVLVRGSLELTGEQLT
jgi:hypothetical protein